MNTSNTKTNHVETQQIVAASLHINSAQQTLMNFDRYFANLGYDSDHPWRVEIAAVQMQCSHGDDVVSSQLQLPAPYTAVSLPQRAIEDHFSMRVSQLTAILSMMEADPAADVIIGVACTIAHEMYEQKLNTGNCLSSAAKLERLLYLMDDCAGEAGDMLWLCQQLVDEVCAIAAAVQSASPVEVAA